MCDLRIIQLAVFRRCACPDNHDSELQSMLFTITSLQISIRGPLRLRKGRSYQSLSERDANVVLRSNHVGYALRMGPEEKQTWHRSKSRGFTNLALATMVRGFWWIDYGHVVFGRPRLR